MRKIITFLGILFLVGSILSPVSASAVVKEIALIADISGSIDATEFALQKNGYAGAFTGTVANLFNDPNLTVDPFYATYGVWSGAGEQAQLVAWTYIHDAASAAAFGNAIAATARPYGGLTAVQNALQWGGTLFNNNIASDLQVIDISGDGVRNDGLTGTAGRDSALAAGVDTINGLVIGGDPAVYTYYQNFVIGGTNPLIFQANDFATFSSAMDQKITYEVTGQVPLPGAVLLLGGGLFRLAGYGLRRRKMS